MSNKIKREMNKIEIPKQLSERSIMGVNQAKGKLLFYIFFIILLIINTAIFRWLYMEYAPWKASTATAIITIFFYIIVLIPLTFYLAEKVASFSVRRGLGKTKNLILFIIIIIAIPMVMVLNDYREKDLDDVIRFKSENVDYILFGQDMKTEKVEHIQGLKKLLSQYRVKKMKDREWDSDVSKEKGFQVTIYSNGKPIMANIYENRIHYFNGGDYYKVVNDPIDMKWIDEIYEELQ